MEPLVLKPRKKNHYAWIFLFEFIGTSIMLFAVLLCEGNVFVAILMIYIAIVICGKYSGAHFNGAVTLTIYVLEHKNWRKNLKIALTYWTAEICGSYFGITIAYSFAGNSLVFLHPGSLSYKPIFIAYVEFVCTFLLMTSIVYVKYS